MTLKEVYDTYCVGTGIEIDFRYSEEVAMEMRKHNLCFDCNFWRGIVSS